MTRKENVHLHVRCIVNKARNRRLSITGLKWHLRGIGRAIAPSYVNY